MRAVWRKICCEKENGTDAQFSASVARERFKAKEDNVITRRVNVQPDRGRQARAIRSRAAPHVFP